MAPGAPRGKRKVARGGGKQFSRNLRPLEDDEENQPREKAESDDESSEEESEEELNAAAPASRLDKPQTREERKAADKARKEAAKAKLAGPVESEDEDSDADEAEVKVLPKLAPRGQVGGHAGIKVSNPNDAANVVPGALSRREREAVDAAAAKERYWKLQEAGKTDQAKSDMARLQLIRQEREEKAKQRKAEAEERKAEADAKADSRGKRR